MFLLGSPEIKNLPSKTNFALRFDGFGISNYANKNLGWLIMVIKMPPNFKQ
jgi:hypothetical protein